MLMMIPGIATAPIKFLAGFSKFAINRAPICRMCGLGNSPKTWFLLVGCRTRTQQDCCARREIPDTYFQADPSLRLLPSASVGYGYDIDPLSLREFCGINVTGPFVRPAQAAHKLRRG
jgi:hypothetical protein